VKVYIVRHGETFENLNKITQGHLNSKLTLKGIEQAKKIAERLKNIEFDVAFSSDLDRAKDTMNIILNYHPKTKVHLTKILREQSKGIFEGRAKKEKINVLKNNNILYHEWLPDGGECITNVWNNVIPFFEGLKTKYFDKTILIVSHGGPISCLLAYLHGDTVENLKKYTPLKNTAISEIEIDDNNLRIHSLNCSEHLK